MIEEERKGLIKQELYEAIAYFIERQDLVAQAILDLGLDLDEMAMFGALAWVSSTTHIIKGVEKPMELFAEGSDFYEVSKRAEEIRVPQKGIWRDYDHNEWEYFLHGGGCRLLNRETGEWLNWDCPDRLAFDPWFFCQHFKWQLDSSDRQDKLIHTQEWVRELEEGESDNWVGVILEVEKLIDEMIEEGLINQDKTLPKR